MVWICPCRINRMLILKIHTAKDASALQGKFLLRREGCVIDTYVNAPCSWRESSIGQDLYSRLLNLPCWVGKWKPKIKFCKGSPLTDRWISKQDTTHSCDLNEIRGNESLYCFEGSGSVLGCEDWSRALCLSSACMRLLEHESSRTCLIFNSFDKEKGPQPSKKRRGELRQWSVVVDNWRVMKKEVWISKYSFSKKKFLRSSVQMLN